MNTSIQDCSALPNGWKREVCEYLNSSKNIRGKYKTTAYTFKGEKYVTKYQLAEAFSKITKNTNGVDLSSFDWKNGKWIRQHHKQKKNLEQLSTELFGKGITDINFTISEPNKILKRNAAKLSSGVKIVELTDKTKGEIKLTPKRPPVPEYDFNYDRDQGINGTPIEQPAKKRQKQSNPMTPFGPLQVFAIKRLANTQQFNGKLINPVKIIENDNIQGDNNTTLKTKIITQPTLPKGMNTSVIKPQTKNIPEVPFKMDDKTLYIDDPDAVENDFEDLLPDDALWKQAILCLTFDGKALPNNTIWGQNKTDFKRISKTPDVFINALQPFVNHFTITKEVIADQASRVRNLREELGALRSEILTMENEEMDLVNSCY